MGWQMTRFGSKEQKAAADMMVIIIMEEEEGLNHRCSKYIARENVSKAC